MNKVELEKALEEGPENIKKAQLEWAKKKLDRQKFEASLYAEIKTGNPDLSPAEIKRMVEGSEGRYKVCMDEYLAEAEYDRLYESHLSCKALAKMRDSY